MSNRRRPARINQYRSGYLRSKPWFARRSRWFAEEEAAHGVIRCTVCSGHGSARTLELHHLDYAGVHEDATGWVAAEPHGDLVAAHPRCHEWIHKLIDRDTVLGGMMGRRPANLQAINRLRAKIAQHVEIGAAPDGR